MGSKSFVRATVDSLVAVVRSYQTLNHAMLDICGTGILQQIAPKMVPLHFAIRTTHSTFAKCQKCFYFPPRLSPIQTSNANVNLFHSRTTEAVLEALRSYMNIIRKTVADDDEWAYHRH